MRLRFVAQKTLVSAGIRFEEDFWASHVEAVLSDGYLGAHAEGGTQLRPVGYDKATLLREEFVDIPCTPEQDKAWEAFLRSKIGTPYDFSAILGIVLKVQIGSQNRLICSALQMQALISSGRVKSIPLPVEEISPRDVRLFIAGLE